MADPVPEKKRKRVRFADEEEEIGGGKADDEHQAKRVSLGAAEDNEHREKAMHQEAGAQDVSEAHIVLERGEMELLGKPPEKATFMEGIAAAEETYDEDEDAEVFDESGQLMEPFNLNAERKTGYFDDEGNYTHYRDEEGKDAWLDTLGNGPVEGVQAPEAAAPESDEEVLDAEELLAYKKHIIELLQPGETVPNAIRRLAGDGAGDGVQAAVAPRAGRGRSKMRSKTVPEANRPAFEKLTECANLLLQYGDYDVYSDPREKLEEAVQAAEEATTQQVLDAVAALGGEDRPIHSAATGNGGDNAEGVPEDLQQPGLDEDMFAGIGMAGFGGEGSAAGSGLPAGDQGASTSGNPTDSVAGEAEEGNVGRAEGEGGSGEEGAPQEQSGFVWVEESKLWYNSDMGQWYNPLTQCYGDAASGQWFMYSEETGQYYPVSMVEGSGEGTGEGSGVPGVGTPEGSEEGPGEGSGEEPGEGSGEGPVEGYTPEGGEDTAAVADAV